MKVEVLDIKLRNKELSYRQEYFGSFRVDIFNRIEEYSFSYSIEYDALNREIKNLQIAPSFEYPIGKVYTAILDTIAKLKT